MKKKITVLFRPNGFRDQKEEMICSKYFSIARSRNEPEKMQDALVIGRYSVLPYYKELETDLSYNKSELINSHTEHKYIADLKNWANHIDEDGDTLIGLTPRTWTNLSDIPDDPNIKFVLKGETNSKKEKWKTHMFAENKQQAIKVYLRLRDDRFYDNQEIYIREFVELETYFVDEITGQPVTKEFRFFCYQNEVIAGGFYWSNHVDNIEPKPSIEEVPKDFLKRLTKVISKNATFYVIDVAKTKSGEWLLIEINDGQMSGLSEVDPDELYSNLKKYLG